MLELRLAVVLVILVVGGIVLFDYDSVREVDSYWFLLGLIALVLLTAEG